MAGAHEEKEPAAAGGRSRPGEVRKSAVVHATARRYVDVQEPALPQALRDYRRAERRVSGLGVARRRPSSPSFVSITPRSGRLPIVETARVSFNAGTEEDRKSTRLNSSHRCISYA